MFATALPPLAVTAEQIADFCRKHHISWLAVFGSVLRDDFGPDSDVDVLVEFEPGHEPGLEFVSMADELEALIGRRVDFLTPDMLSRWIRPKVMNEARLVYDTA
jgi:predicted nucleotidyltransferase